MKQTFIMYSLVINLIAMPLHGCDESFFTKLIKRAQTHPKIMIGAGLLALGGFVLEVESHIHPKASDQRRPAEPLEQGLPRIPLQDNNRRDLHSGRHYRKPRTGHGPLNAYMMDGVHGEADKIPVRPYQQPVPVSPDGRSFDLGVVPQSSEASPDEQSLSSHSPALLQRASPPTSPSSDKTEPLGTPTHDSGSFAPRQMVAELMHQATVDQERKQLCQEQVQQVQAESAQQLERLAGENHALRAQLRDIELYNFSREFVKGILDNVIENIGKKPLADNHSQAGSAESESKRHAAQQQTTIPVQNPLSLADLFETQSMLQTALERLDDRFKSCSGSLSNDMVACRTRQAVLERSLQQLAQQCELSRNACRTDCLDALHQISFLTKYINSEERHKIMMVFQGELQLAKKELAEANQAKDAQRIEAAIGKLTRLEEMVRTYNEDLPRQIKQQEVNLVQHMHAVAQRFAHKLLVRREITRLAAHQMDQKKRAAIQASQQLSPDFSDEETDTVSAQKTEAHHWNARGSERCGNLTQALADISRPQPSQPQKPEPAALAWAAQAAQRSYSDHGSRSKLGPDGRFHFDDVDPQRNGRQNGAQEVRDAETKVAAAGSGPNGMQPHNGQTATAAENAAKVRSVRSRRGRLKSALRIETPSQLTRDELNLGSEDDGDNDDVIAAGESPAEKLLRQQLLEQQRGPQQQAAAPLASQAAHDPSVTHALGWLASPPETPKHK